MAQPMPESVKVARATHVLSAPASLTGERFDIKIGPDEVMILLAFHYWWGALQFAPGVNEVSMGLWRKADVLPLTNPFRASADMIWAQNDIVNFVTESIKNSNAAYINFPWPMVLIRAPQFLIKTVRVLNIQAEMRLFYLLRDVNDLDLAKLMVKDHA